MLSLLKLKNIALIDRLELEFGPGLNLLTGETGSGKSIIVDSLGALTGDRVSIELIKEGEESAQIEGIFAIKPSPEFLNIVDESGIELDSRDQTEIFIRRDLAATGRNRIFVNNQLVTQSLLKKIGAFLVDIHGQGEQAALYDVASHLEMLDEFANLKDLRKRTADVYGKWSTVKTELGMLRQNETEKLQLLDILKFQIDEIKRADLKTGEEEELEEEKRRLNNIEKLSALSEDSYALLYENTESTIATLEKSSRKIDELSEYESRFKEYIESLRTASAVIEDLAIELRTYRHGLEFSPQRLAEIEDRLVEIARLKRKYGDSVESVLAHLRDAEERRENIETAEFREEELNKKLLSIRGDYLNAANELHSKRIAAARKFEKEVENNLKTVALDKARFEVRIDAPELTSEADADAERAFSAKGCDRVEFYFSANPGDSPKPLAKVASGGEASRLMLVLKTSARARAIEKSAVFDEVDVGIGGRVAQAVGMKLKQLSTSQQVLCVTHQPQIASLADRHFVVSKQITRNRTEISVREIDKVEKVEEIARMLAGEKITEAARENARDMLAAAS